MNINTNVYKQYVNSGRARACQKFSLGGAEKAVSVKKDSFSLSPEASALKECSRAVKKAASEITSSASEDRISSLKSRIADGSYNVSSTKIADAILDRLA
jgi:flagellar biosynthesis anti-sigma factor FlgM